MSEERRSELSAGAALGETSPEELAEMQALGVSEQEIYEMELAAAAIAVANVRPMQMPASLRARLEASAAPVPVKSNVVRPRFDLFRISGWLAAAACLAFVVGMLAMKKDGARPSVAKARADLIATAHDAKVLAWTATADPAGAGAHGDVVWSDQAQAGFMRFTGLSRNDPTATQYQLWIFDPSQDAATPIDGGVFDVSASGEVIVPIHAKLKVTSPTLFAVTVEKPGGVVVSKRERIVVTAKI